MRVFCMCVVFCLFCFVLFFVSVTCSLLVYYVFLVLNRLFFSQAVIREKKSVPNESATG